MISDKGHCSKPGSKQEQSQLHPIQGQIYCVDCATGTVKQKLSIFYTLYYCTLYTLHSTLYTLHHCDVWPDWWTQNSKLKILQGLDVGRWTLDVGRLDLWQSSQIGLISQDLPPNFHYCQLKSHFGGDTVLHFILRTESPATSFYDPLFHIRKAFSKKAERIILPDSYKRAIYALKRGLVWAILMPIRSTFLLTFSCTCRGPNKKNCRYSLELDRIQVVVFVFLVLSFESVVVWRNSVVEGRWGWVEGAGQVRRPLHLSMGDLPPGRCCSWLM